MIPLGDLLVPIHPVEPRRARTLAVNNNVPYDRT